MAEQMTTNEARANLGEVLSKARFAGERTIITSRGRAAAAVVSIEDLQRLERSVRVEVNVFQRGGYWACGEHLPFGVSEIVLFDDPPDPHHPAALYSIEQKLAQLEHGRGGQEVIPSNGEPPRQSPPLLEYRVLNDYRQPVAAAEPRTTP